MPRIAQMIPSNFLKASDLAEGDDYTELDVTITGCTQVPMPGDGEEKWVLKFREESKGLILNKTNTKKLGRLLGDESDAWTGKRVRLYVEYVPFQGDEVPAIRIKAARTPETQLSLENIPA